MEKIVITQQEIDAMPATLCPFLATAAGIVSCNDNQEQSSEKLCEQRF